MTDDCEPRPTPPNCAVAILTGVAAGIGVVIGLSAYAVVWAVGRVWGVR